MIVVRYDEKRCCAMLVWMTDTRTFAQLADAIRATSGPVRLVGVDGCGGAGKTTFAQRLGAAGGWTVVHTDDFATHDDAFGWWPRMLTEVIEPLSQQRSARFRPYDWVRRQLHEEMVTIEPADVVVIEGVGATRHAWRDRLALSVWVDTPRDVRLARGLARDGEQMRAFWEWWIAEEDRYVASEHPQRHADLVVDGDPSEPLPDDRFAVLSAPREEPARPASPR